MTDLDRKYDEALEARYKAVQQDQRDLENLIRARLGMPSHEEEAEAAGGDQDTGKSEDPLLATLRSKLGISTTTGQE